MAAIRSAPTPHIQTSIELGENLCHDFPEVNQIAFIPRFSHPMRKRVVNLNENQVFIGDGTFLANDIYRSFDFVEVCVEDEQASHDDTHPVLDFRCSQRCSLCREATLSVILSRCNDTPAVVEK